MSAPCGLANAANVCSLNALVQCIGHCGALRERLLAGSSAGPLTAALAGLLRDMAEKDCASPMLFAQALHASAPLLRAGEEQDMSEVYILLLHALEAELAAGGAGAAPPWPEAYADPRYDAMARQASAHWRRTLGTKDATFARLTTGLQVGQVVCVACGHCSHTFETFTVLSLAVPNVEGELLLSQCLDAYMADEQLDAFACDRCRGTGAAVRSQRFWRAPDVLVIALTRFRPDGAGGCSKVHAPVSLPTRIDFLPGIELAAGAAPPAYGLAALGCHFGGLDAGHYTALCRRGERWYHCDDAHVAGPLQPPLARNPHAYMLVYERL
jgi:ubiquitin carboxyl-terminal hydrolase 8